MEIYLTPIGEISEGEEREEKRRGGKKKESSATVRALSVSFHFKTPPALRNERRKREKGQ